MAFTDPDPELQLLREDLAWPPTLGSTGDLTTLRKLDNLEAAVVARAATTRGEIIHRPDYGLEDGGQSHGQPLFDEDLAGIEARLFDQYTRETRLQSVSVSVAADTETDGDVVATLRAVARSGQPIGITVPMSAGG